MKKTARIGKIDVSQCWELSRLLLLLLAICASGLASCTPFDYRLRADAETYGILDEKTQDPFWWTPPFSIEAPPNSRNYDPFEPECSPIPPDDPAAHDLMHSVDGRAGYGHWEAHGTATDIGSPQWRGFLELNEDEELNLDAERAVELGLLNSREYHFELEELYLDALSLSLDRFEYDLQWVGGNSTFYDFLGRRISGRPAGLESNGLSTFTDFGFQKAFTSGGQLLADFANTFVWEFTGTNSTQTLSTVSIGLVQPLLRRAFRDVRLEALTQGERSVLYSARDYARFRKQFYFDIVSGDQGYLSLLLLLQSIRNLEANLISLEENLRAHEALARAGIVAPITVDQVFQSYQTGRLRLIRARNNLNNALDTYKIRLGLPPEIEVVIDDSQLTPFELNSPEITQLQSEIEEFVVRFRELGDAPSAEQLAEGFDALHELHRRALEQADEVLEQWRSWDTREPSVVEEDSEQAARIEDARESLKSRLDDLKADLEEAASQLEEAAAEVRLSDEIDGWETIRRLSRRESAYIGDLFVIQSQIRAYLIPIDPIDLEPLEAVWYALNNRLDLMNTRAQVVDEWRRIRVAADGLEAELDLVGNATVGTPAGGNNPVRFSSADSRFRVGFRFDSPLNRKAERNIYRAQVVNYERSRRQYLSRRDAIVQAVRRDLRELEADQLNFEIARQTLIAAARQVEQARIELLAPNPKPDSSATRDALEALNGLLNAKNALIAVWVSFETNRLQLLLDTEALQLDERGLPQYGDLDESESDDFEVILPGIAENTVGDGV